MSEKLMHAIHTGHGCEKCPYLEGTESGEECVERLHSDAFSLLKAKQPKFGRWKQTPAGMTPGGTSLYICGNCGGSDHLHGAEYPKRKIVCDCCGQINIYPWETAYEEGSSLWPKEEKT